MIEDDIKQLVDGHYQDPDAEILLLSNVGMRLTEEGRWPPANDRRSLYEAAQATPGITLVRDEDAQSFIAVVLTGEEQRAAIAIADRRTRYFLRGLPRALLIAFTLDLAAGQIMTLRLGAKISYLAGPAVEDGTVIVDQDLRLPGLDVIDLGVLSAEQVKQLEANIKAWCERHQVEPASLLRLHGKPVSAPQPAPAVHASALERLYAAQDPEVSKRLRMPIDIALALSRMP